MSLDMSAFPPAELPDDWVPGEFGNLDAVTLTFTAGGETHLREFDSALAAMGVVPLLLAGFEFSLSRNAVRLGSGEVVLLPVQAKPRKRVGPDECTLVAQGHRPHWGPALRAANRPGEEWVPVTFLEVDGNRVTMQTPTGIEVVYDHNPDRLVTAVEYNARWSMLRGAWDGQGRCTAHWVSHAPITPCTA
ncbi:hypothetical protein [Corynebacterium sp. UBA2622]|uniref:hypothetical protein n=1 Tax=Corynebacterium sp. UBA2622 TaxID=1946393 RepID=UPI0025BC004C|nr:hypothetical protein [Corynebacterium sp. UBA2622]